MIMLGNTKRPVSEGAEKWMEVPIPVLDHGFVRLVDYMGNDQAVTNAARTSYGKGTKTISDDEALIRTLMRDWHTSCFEMAEIKVHMKLPIFVARQIIRHRTANVNEYSARYSVLENEFYIPAPEDLASQSLANKQGRDGILHGEEAARVLDILRDDAARSYANYESMLSTEGQDGLSRELARMNLPVSVYTQWYWKTDLHNLLHFLRLRMDPHAQKEVRVYADALGQIVQDWCPIVWSAFEEYRLNAMQLSATEIRILARALAGDTDIIDASFKSKRERSAFISKLEKLRKADVHK